MIFRRIGMVWLGLCSSLVTSMPTTALAAEASPPQVARVPLKVLKENPRYFTAGTKGPDGRLKAIYLTGSHTWGNLSDFNSRKWPDFDYARYLQFLRLHNHNFFRL